MTTANYNFQHNVLRQQIENIRIDVLENIIKSRNEYFAKKIFFDALEMANLAIFCDSYKFKCDFFQNNENGILIYYFDDCINGKVVSECYASLIVLNKEINYFTIEYGFDENLVLGQIKYGSHYNFGFYSDGDIFKIIDDALELVSQSTAEENTVQRDFLGFPMCNKFKKAGSNSFKTDKDVVLITRLQKTIIGICIALIIFIIVCPIILTNRYQEVLSSLPIEHTQLSNLNANQQAYYVDGDYQFVFTKSLNGKLKKYEFYKRDADGFTSTNKGRIPNATSYSIKKYFGEKVVAGLPSLAYTVPVGLNILVFGILFFLSLLAVIIIILSRKIKEKIFNLEKSDAKFNKNKTKYIDGDISRYEYKRARKYLFSVKTLHNNKFFELFKVLY